MFDKVPLTFEYDDVITVTWHILCNLIMMLLKTGQQKNPQNLKLERITNQKIQKLSKIHVYIAKYMRLNTWDTHIPMGTKGLTSIIRTGIPILLEMIDLVNSVIIFLSQMTLPRWLTFLFGFQIVVLIVLLFWIYFFLLTLLFLLQ